MVESGSVCVVRSDQLRAGGGGEVRVGALCEVGEDGQPGIIIGASSEAALSILENCMKQNMPTDTVKPSTTESNEVGMSVGVARGNEVESGGQRWASELAALLSVSKTPAENNSGQKRSPPVSMETQNKRRKVEATQSGAVVRPATVPTVVPSKPVLVGGAKCGAGPRGKPAVGVAVGGTKGERKKQTREIDVPPPPSPPQKTDPLSQILHEVREIRRSYSTLVGSLLIVRRNQEDIKNRLTEIGLSIATNSTDPLILSSDPSPSSMAISEVTGGQTMDQLEIVPGDPAHPHTLQGINLTATFPEFDPEYLLVTRGKSCSRRNFAVNLVRYLYTPEEMAQCNCSGTRGKAKLEQERLAVVRRTTLTLWPVEDRAQERSEWGKCIYSIDEACRRLNRPRVKKREEGLVLETEVESFMMGGASQL